MKRSYYHLMNENKLCMIFGRKIIPLSCIQLGSGKQQQESKGLVANRKRGENYSQIVWINQILTLERKFIICFVVDLFDMNGGDVEKTKEPQCN